MFDEAAAEEAAAEEVARASAPPAAPRSYRDSTPPSPRSSSRALGATIALLVAAALVVAFWMMSRRVEPPAPGTVANEEASPAAPDAAGDEPRRSAELEAPLPAARPERRSGARAGRRAVVEPGARDAGSATPTSSARSRPRSRTPAWGRRRRRTSPFLRPREPYRAVERSGADGPELVPDPASYRRYDLVTAVFTSIDPQAAADVYRRLHGLVQEAYADLGYPDESVDTALATAFETLLQTPVPATAPALEQHLNTYHYADPRLEALQPAQKQLLRMGPENAARVQDQLRSLAAALDLPVD